MSQQEAIKLFETQKVRTYWDNEKEEWYFCINDVIKILINTIKTKGKYIFLIYYMKLTYNYSPLFIPK